MKYGSSIDRMYVETNADFAGAHWMDIRFQHSCPPLKPGEGSTSDGMYFDASRLYAALDVHMQRSRLAEQYD